MSEENDTVVVRGQEFSSIEVAIASYSVVMGIGSKLVEKGIMEPTEMGDLLKSVIVGLDEPIRLTV